MYLIASLSLLLANCGLLNPASADDKPAATQPASDTFARLLPPEILDQLQLNEEQKEDLARLQREFRDKCLEVRAQAQNTAQKYRVLGKKPVDRATQRQLADTAMLMVTALQKLKSEYEMKLRAALTEEQQRRYDAWKRDVQNKPSIKKTANDAEPCRSPLPPG